MSNLIFDELQPLIPKETHHTIKKNVEKMNEFVFEEEDVNEIIEIIREIKFYDESEFFKFIKNKLEAIPDYVLFNKNIKFSSNTKITERLSTYLNCIAIEYENLEMVKPTDKLVIVDDFSGTGSQMKEMLNKIKEINNDVDTIVICYAVTLDSINTFEQEHITFEYCHLLKSYALSSQFLNQKSTLLSENEEYIQNTLFVNGAQSPNNNLSLLWKTKKHTWQSIFKRKIIPLNSLRLTIKEEIETTNIHKKYELSINQLVDYVIRTNKGSLFEEEHKNRIDEYAEEHQLTSNNILDKIVDQYNKPCRDTYL